MPCSYSYMPICSWTRLLIKLIVYLMNTERINNYFDYRVAMETKWLTVRAMGFIVYLKLYLLGTHVIHGTQETVRPWQVSWLFLNPIKRVACGWTGQPPKLFWCRIEDYRICRTKKGMVICAAAGEWWPRGGIRLDLWEGTKTRSQGGTAERNSLSFVERPTHITMVSVRPSEHTSEHISGDSD